MQNNQNIKLITIKDIVKRYSNTDEDGVFCYNGNSLDAFLGITMIATFLNLFWNIKLFRFCYPSERAFLSLFFSPIKKKIHINSFTSLQQMGEVFVSGYL